MFNNKERLKAIELALRNNTHDIDVLRGQIEVMKYICSPIFNSSGDIVKLATEVRLAEAREKARINGAQEAERINRILETKGGEIRNLRKQIHETMLSAQRHGSDITEYKAQLKILDWIMGGLK